MVLREPGTGRLESVELPRPEPGPGDLLVRVEVCGVCRTDLHLVDGELPEPKLPIVPGHEVVGRVEALGAAVDTFGIGQRVGIPWLGWTCGRCRDCRADRENLCPNARFTGYQRDGGYAEYAVADARYAFAIPDSLVDPIATAPLLCAGLIGHRALRIAIEGRVDARRIGFYGFGASAHLLCQLATRDGREVFAFTRPGDVRTQRFARTLGAVWAGGSDEWPPEPLDAAVLFAPVGALVPLALGAVRPGGVVVCAGIHMSDIPSFPYRTLWGERVLRSVANLTRHDARELLEIAGREPFATRTAPYALADANRALDDLRTGKFDGAAVLVVGAGGFEPPTPTV
jgi:alcohol dehydrogenase, propanol-preferring